MKKKLRNILEATKAFTYFTLNLLYEYFDEIQYLLDFILQLIDFLSYHFR